MFPLRGTLSWDKGLIPNTLCILISLNLYLRTDISQSMDFNNLWGEIALKASSKTFLVFLLLLIFYFFIKYLSMRPKS